MDLTHSIIEYVNCCVGAFANKFNLTLAQSYAYLRRFNGIDFLIDKSQAMDMAIRTYRRSQEGEPTVNTYLFDDNLLLNKNAPLSIKIFEEYSVEWAEFVLMNRKNMTTTPVHHYDIVIGPIANDTVGLQMRRFMQGYIDMERMLDELRFHKPAIQYFFGTEKAINYLKKV